MTDYLRKQATNVLPCEHCARMAKALTEARAHARGASKRETAAREDAFRMARQLQSLRDKIKRMP